jgi:hypothetical protein
MFSTIIKELKHHMPFTALGALSGIVFMYFFRNIPQKLSYELFYVFHPAHVLLSALATAGMYKHYACPNNRKKCNLGLLLTIGCVGSIGVATLSDSVMPYIGEIMLGMHDAHMHVGFIEKWWLIVMLAVIGIMIAYVNPTTRFPHAAHVFVSTWASLFHVLMVAPKNAGIFVYLGIFIFLFIAVWVPCCVSDIVFPLLFVGKKDHSH